MFDLKRSLSQNPKFHQWFHQTPYLKFALNNFFLSPHIHKTPKKTLFFNSPLPFTLLPSFPGPLALGAEEAAAEEAATEEGATEEGATEEGASDAAPSVSEATVLLGAGIRSIIGNGGPLWPLPLPFLGRSVRWRLSCYGLRV